MPKKKLKTEDATVDPNQHKIKTIRRNVNKYSSEVKIFIIASEIFIDPDIQ